jgi:hypothetical protein
VGRLRSVGKGPQGGCDVEVSDGIRYYLDGKRGRAFVIGARNS